MSNEISLALNFSVLNPVSSTPQFKQVIQQTGQFNQNAVGAAGGTILVATTGTDLTTSFANVSTYGLLFLLNLDPANYVTYGPVSAGAMVPLGKIKPGEFQILRLNPGVDFKAQANTAAVEVQYLLLQD